MTVYKAPLRDIRFILRELVHAEQLVDLPGCEEATPDQIDFVLEELAGVCQELLLPLNRSGDEEGCHYDDGVVTTPAGFKEAYAKYVEAGWPTMACDPEYDGMGLPKTVSLLGEEMLSSANLSFSVYPLLTTGAYTAIFKHGTDELKRTYLPRMVEGSWSGTMCLTEAQCGTDLGLVRTRAIPQDDGSYRVTGSKIFISAGEHDLTANIIHLVLARLPDAPSGTRGISLFVVPKFLVGEDGSLGERNGVVCGGIEKKMGVSASSTCVLDFDDAVGYLVGQPNRGMSHMFTMMNAARLGVGMQGLGLAEVAYQNARAYAKDRLQGRALREPRYPEREADPLIVHPDIRRMLMTMRANTEGARGLAGWVGLNLDLAEHHPDPAVREEAGDLVDLLTPVVKAYFTDHGFAAANLAVQIYGGHGYIRETGVEQFVRDARIAQIWEGANGVQGLDLVGRKLGMHNGRLLRRFFHPVAAYLEAHQNDVPLAEFVAPLAKAFGRLQQATARIAQQGLRDPDEAAAVSSDYLRLFALVALGYMWVQMAEISLERLGTTSPGDPKDMPFYQAKIACARFYFQKLLPETSSLFAVIMAGAAPVMALGDDGF
ncbi:MAG: acyl-CoA dehydrogenase C-terminal domain-containing protein [Actinobacteria bacterium]|nr:acyl-CoA dehydrogenase C-terminal domain-containing protein [Actinomycetota bacterium]